MIDPSVFPDADTDPARLLVIVTGAHLRAEIADRPVAYRLRDRIAAMLRERGESESLRPVVCTDVWLLNTDDLRACPLVSIGAPDVNALTASLASRIPAVFSVRDALAVHLDLEFIDLAALCWGVTPGATADAVEAFAERYLDRFVEESIVNAELNGEAM